MIVYVTFGVGTTRDRIGASIRTWFGDINALIVYVTFGMGLPTGEEGVTLVILRTGNNDACSFLAHRVLSAVEEGRAFIGTATFIYKTNSTGIVTDEVLNSTISTLQAFIGTSSR